MKLLLIGCCALVLAIGIPVGLGAGEASAFSPDIQAIEKNQADIKLDIGYFYDDLIGAKPFRTRAGSEDLTGGSDFSGWYFPASPQHTIPGVSNVDVNLLHEMQQGPGHYLETLRAARLNGPEPGSPMLSPSSSTTELPWVSDGLTENESITLEFLAELSALNPAAAERIATMPFLRSFGPADLEAVWSLTYLAEFDYEEGTSVLNEVLDNPHLADHNGIDDMEARVVAVLGGTQYFAPELVPTLLDTTQITLYNYVLPRVGGDIEMTVIRTEPGSFRTDGLFSYAIEQAQDIMAKPLRTDYVAVLIHDDTLPGFAAGGHFGTHITIPTRFDTDNDAEYPGSWSGSLIAHEVAHYYWFFNHSLWVSEGAADFIAALNESRRVGRVMEPDNVPCSFYDSIFHLELAKPDLSSYGGLCHYTLGERLWLDLHATLGEDDVLDSFREFYSTPSEDEEAEIPTRVHLTGAVTPSDATGPDAVIRSMLLNKHYGNVLRSESSPVNPRISALNGQVTDVLMLRVNDGRIAEVLSDFPSIPASSIVNRYLLALQVEFAAPLPADRELAFGMLEYFEDGWVFDRTVTQHTFEAGSTNALVPLGYVGFIPNFRWPAGLYWVYAYYAGQKIGEFYLDVSH